MQSTLNIRQLANQLGQELMRRKYTVSCAESCTGGGIAYAITDIAGSSAWFNQGYVVYSNVAKHNLLGVSDDLLQKFGAVSEQVVLEMAKAAADGAKADIAVAVSGIAGPDGGSELKPVGTVCFGFAGTALAKDLAFTQHFNGNREQVREQTIVVALEKLIQGLND